MPDAATRDRLLRRIGLTEAPAPDAARLRTVHRAFVLSVPYENIAVQLGETEPLGPYALVQRILAGGRGGYCFEANTVLQTLLEAVGFTIERREGIVGPRDAHHRGEPVNHMALIAHTPDAGPFIAEAGLGEGPLDPLPLTAGPVTAGAFRFTIERDSEGWWVAQHAYGSIPGFRFSDMPATLVRGPAGNDRHDGGIDDITAGQAVDPPGRVHHRQGVGLRTHQAGTSGMVGVADQAP
jgi:N-hydroxyarylamine O-acetyltransferase